MTNSRTHTAVGGLFGFRRPVFRLETISLPITDLVTPALLSFSLPSFAGEDTVPLVKEGEEITQGQPIAKFGDLRLLSSPVKGKVVAIVTAPDIYGGEVKSAVIVEPIADSGEAPFAALDVEQTDLSTLKNRIDEAGVFTNTVQPRPLGAVLCPKTGKAGEPLIVLAVDREPLVNACMALFKERSQDAAVAATLLGKIAGVSKVVLAVIEPLAAQAKQVCQQHGIEVIAVEPKYPQSLEPIVALRAGGKGNATVVALETALAALDAVREGKVQTSKVLTVIGADGKAMANLRVPLGVRIRDVFSHLGLHPEEHDKVVAGGPMRGISQFSLDGAIDAGVDALMVIPRGKVVPWSDESCINCGNCLEVCPVALQVHLICRYSEFALFERTAEFEIEQCIECGLCAATCIARRPLLQFIRLAKHQLQKQREIEPPSAEEQNEQAGA